MINTPNSWPALEIAYDDDGLISLTAPSTGYDEGDTVRLHPGQLVDLAQKVGLSGQANPAALRVIRTMKRRMESLRDRINRLDDMLRLCGDHENLISEQDFSFATWELAGEYCCDLDDLLASAVPPHQEPQERTHCAPHSSRGTEMEPREKCPAPANQLDLLEQA